MLERSKMPSGTQFQLYTGSPVNITPISLLVFRTCLVHTQPLRPLHLSQSLAGHNRSPHWFTFVTDTLHLFFPSICSSHSLSDGMHLPCEHFVHHLQTDVSSL
jgi:hypothetical protein